MIDLTKIQGMLQYIEKGIEERFGSQAGYQQVKAVLEGKAENVDTKALVKGSCGVFSVDNKPELLMTSAIENLDTFIDVRTKLISPDVEAQGKYIAERIEKNTAILENRPSKIVHEVKEEEALFTGRLVAADGLSPVAGAKVVIHGTGTAASKVIATAVTDENGEYVIRMDEKLVKEASKKVKITFNTPKEENIAASGALPLAKGKLKPADAKVAEEKNELAAELVRDPEERKRTAMLEMVELKKGEAELKLLHFQAERSATAIKTTLDGLKELFKEKTS